MAREVIRTKNFARDAAQYILREGRTAVAERNEFRVALSGGNTPRPVYAELARFGAELPVDRCLFTFSDERCVPPDDEKSNYRMAKESLLDPLVVPEESVLRMRGEITPALAASEYETSLNALAAARSERIYRHDLLLLGLGEDGHTASLFPGTAALNETAHKVVANFVTAMNAWRVTVTFPLIEAARRVCFLVDGRKHAELLERVWKADSDLPAARVDRAATNVTWILADA